MNLNNLKTILDYSYETEIEDLENCIYDEDDTFVELPPNLIDAIKFIKEEHPIYTNHIGYNLMILKQDLENEFK